MLLESEPWSGPSLPHPHKCTLCSGLNEHFGQILNIWGEGPTQVWRGSGVLFPTLPLQARLYWPSKPRSSAGSCNSDWKLLQVSPLSSSLHPQWCESIRPVFFWDWRSHLYEWRNFSPTENATSRSFNVHDEYIHKIIINHIGSISTYSIRSLITVYSNYNWLTFSEYLK